MLRESFKAASLVSAVQPFWRWVCGSYGGRTTTALGLTMIAISAIAASCQEAHPANLALVVLGGIGMGLVRLQVRMIKHCSEESTRPLWGAGVSGIGLAFWPLLACLFVLKLGPRYAILTVAGITLHGLPLAYLIKPRNETAVCDGNRAKNLEDSRAEISPASAALPNVTSTHEKYSPSYKLVEYDSYRVRPSCFVEVLPGIPEESEHESECEIDGEMQLKADSKLRVNRREESRRLRFEEREKGRGKNAFVQGTTAEPFAYTLFVANVVLRIADQVGIAIVVSLLPSLAERLLPDFRMQEKAFLISLCGFSRLLTELPLILFCKSPTRTRIVVLFGPLLASLGLYLAWISASLDSITLASLGIGIGAGAASAALQLISSRESPEAYDIADIVVGAGLSAMLPLMRVFVLGNAIRGSFLVGAWLYAAAAILAAFNMRRRT